MKFNWKLFIINMIKVFSSLGLFFGCLFCCVISLRTNILVWNILAYVFIALSILMLADVIGGGQVI